ncbi:alpha-galactosidase [Tessaracoccus antarcticus]|uniref:alpha-galactosidase n=1 Tax=Tessaracoccus antarcticus TaxID=2479848 RepID=A0A3M0GL20_9ACTN|nr:alpha-galactosidase [Tessaracoccus antarcticus]RMB62313.1 alpha-galactosidase [Tessaracoccus antarcticus]
MRTETTETTASRPTPTPSSHPVVHLRRGGTSVVVDVDAPDGPVIVHWGEELERASDTTLSSLVAATTPQRVSGGLDRTGRLGVLSTPARGWLGTPGIEGHGARGSSLSFRVTGLEVSEHEASLRLTDEESGLTADLELRVGASGLFHQRITVHNASEDNFTLTSLHAAFPVPWDGSELVETTGRHLRERSAVRHEFSFGTHLRESRRGRPGADATLLLATGRPGFGFERGRVHGIHVAWSGNHRVIAERVTTGEAFLAGGELLLPGEGTLAPGESLSTPWVMGSWGDGLSELSHRFHDEWRARPQHPRRPRPVTLNTWEAVYFEHDLDRLTELADVAAAVGVERFVLDDGWFTGRRDDTAGLGDWFVDEQVWPGGLHPLVEHVHTLGMEFGLWVEPEMVNPNSNLARDHPHWLLQGRQDLPPSGRQQQVLNLAHPDAYAFIAGRLHALLDDYPISYLKWDHNRDLVDAGSGPGGRSMVHEHTLALYGLLDELTQAHPGLEIESCASGGARVDLGILDRTDRIWTSDCLDPIERLENQKYTSLVVPPEMMGMHLTSPVVHSTGRTVSLNLSAAVALFGHFGIEWDLTRANDATRARITDWVTFAKDIRDLVATGHIVFTDGTDTGLDVRGIVAANRSRAIYTVTQATTTITYPPAPITLPGLDPHTHYQVRLLHPGGQDPQPGQSPLIWPHQETVLTGRELSTIGLRPPVQYPQQATIIEVLHAS